jgi:hypothetical protein
LCELSDRAHGEVSTFDGAGEVMGRDEVRGEDRCRVSKGSSFVRNVTRLRGEMRGKYY